MTDGNDSNIIAADLAAHAEVMERADHDLTVLRSMLKRSGAYVEEKEHSAGRQISLRVCAGYLNHYVRFDFDKETGRLLETGAYS